MQLQSNFRLVSLLIIVQCLLFLNGYYNSVIFLEILTMGSILFDFLRRRKHRSKSNQRLSLFRCSSSYDLIHIRSTTTTQVLNDIIFHLKNARKYSMTSKIDGQYGEKMSVYIDASLSNRSLIIIIEYDHERDVNTSYASTLHDLFKVIFERSKFILAWGDLRVELQFFLPFDLFTDTQLIEVYPIDLQHMFQQWHQNWLKRTKESIIEDDSK